jgi:hypothetical protein
MLVHEGTVAAFFYLEEILTVFLSKVLYYFVTLSFLDITCTSPKKNEIVGNKSDASNGKQLRAVLRIIPG